MSAREGSYHTSLCCWLSWGPGAWWGVLGLLKFPWPRESTPLTVLSLSAEQMKAELEAELGLKIVQTGVGEVRP